MHSSRMRTVRCSGHGGECLPGGRVCLGVCLPAWGGLPRGECLPGGCTPHPSICGQTDRHV